MGVQLSRSTFEHPKPPASPPAQAAGPRRSAFAGAASCSADARAAASPWRFIASIISATYAALSGAVAGAAVRDVFFALSGGARHPGGPAA